ncbi:phospholipase D family protein [Pseudorhizobium endolithicum]|uniref:Phospholipase D n=1 Tax=Pseudorhizobium endolithicum TaxID=1191678 RepID=A0ABM8PI87_9HYPH|nr:phospholipase D family protein [Pseudorhizobium endolithicum]CAD7031704.1 phospholipase D family protein [Pseudorhizobium endolithicum]
MLTRILFLAIAAMIVALAIAHFVFRPPSLDGRTVTQAVQASNATPLGKLALSRAGEQDDRSGVLPLLDGPDAFVARIALIRAAQVAVDVQYYIWQRDATGLILLDELREAAERGVRIRLLLDDNGIAGLDADLAALDTMPGVEIRLFNPFILGTFKPLGYAFDFVRLNRRMHNKSLTADGAVSILGGRNIGDVYFGFGTGVQFIDTEVMVTGAVADAIGADFDRYWHSRSAHPLDRLVEEGSPASRRDLEQEAEAAMKSEEGRLYAERLRDSSLVRQLAAGRLEFEWTRVSLVSDDPAKGLGEAEERNLLFPQLMTLLSRPTRSVDLVSAYFVPGRQFTTRLEELSRSGIRVRVLTNSQAATDVTVVHSAYVKYRVGLLQAGVELYELKPAFGTPQEPDTVSPSGSSRSSLHSKTLAVDESRIFVGSFNFDPRSLLLNTEMGVVVDSPILAGFVSQAFSERLPAASIVPS